MTSARLRILLAVLSGCVLLAPAARAAENAGVLNVGPLPYVSGGAGTESIARSNSKSGKFNLKLVFAPTSRKHPGNVQVRVADEAGSTFLDAPSEGSWLLAKLPAGRYRVSATLGDSAMTRNVVLDATKLKTLNFRWGSE